jgi:hypothetical protein
MKTVSAALLTVLVVFCGRALADCGNSSSYLNISQVNTILAGHYACGASSATDPPGWNELHQGGSGGSLVEQHEGGATVETVGTWATANASGRGRVTYTYSGGSSDVYEIAVLSGNCSSGCTTLPQAYAFCGVGGSAPARLQIYVSTSFQAPSSPGVMNGSCPSNP